MKSHLLRKNTEFCLWNFHYALIYIIIIVNRAKIFVVAISPQKWSLYLSSVQKVKAARIGQKRRRTQRESGDTLSPCIQLCVRQEAGESEIKTRLWAFTLRRRAGGAHAWQVLIDFAVFYPQAHSGHVRKRKQTPTKGCQKWNTIVYKQTNKLLLVIIERTRDQKIQFLPSSFFFTKYPSAWHSSFGAGRGRVKLQFEGVWERFPNRGGSGGNAITINKDSFGVLGHSYNCGS
jgi:hypothetical protein